MPSANFVLHKATISVTSGGSTATQTFFFNTSDIYEGIKTEVGIEKAADTDADEPVFAVKELMRAGLLFRFGVIIESTGGKRDHKQILCIRTKIGDIFNNNNLIGKDYKYDGTVKGIIKDLSSRRRATFY